MSSLVSVLIPAYNAAEWISGAIRSALAQTWPKTEIIVVDDGSSDATLTVARQFESTEVAVVTQENQGAARARNRAFSLSQGDYIQWLDADDLLAPQKIARQMEARDVRCTPRTLLSSTWGSFMYRPQRGRFIPTALWCDLSPAEWLTRKMEQNLYMAIETWLVSRELTEAAGPWNTQLLVDDDGEYFCRVLLASDAVRFVPGAKVFIRRVGPGRVSYIGGSDRKLESQFASMRQQIGCLLSLENSERTRAACVDYLQTWLHHFYPNRLDIVGEMTELAANLEGQLELPRLSWKYDWIRRSFGWGPAKRAQLAAPRMKWAMLRLWDRMLS